MKKTALLLICTGLILFSSTSYLVVQAQPAVLVTPILPAADQLEAYLPLLKGKKVGLMGNQTSIVGPSKEHLVDVLLREGVDLKFGFAPEHGFRGDIERGEKVSNDKDTKTGLPLYTL